MSFFFWGKKVSGSGSWGSDDVGFCNLGFRVQSLRFGVSRNRGILFDPRIPFEMVYDDSCTFQAFCLVSEVEHLIRLRQRAFKVGVTKL